MDNDFVSVGAPLPRIVEAIPGEGRMARILWKTGIAEWVDLTGLGQPSCVRPAAVRRRAFCAAACQ